jgi:transcriptional regulator with XRE-family HTH domain
MAIPPIEITIRSKKLGVLIRQARHKLGKSVAECALAIEVSEEDFNQFEFGEKSPSLPEIEALAYYLNLPLEYFLGREDLPTPSQQTSLKNLEKLTLLRNRVIGAKIRKSRYDTGLSLKELSQMTGISEEKLTAYEFGDRSIPLPELESITKVLNQSPLDYLDERGPIGYWRKQRYTMRQIQHFPPDLQEFISKPVNRPYLELAQRLSEMSVDKLRAVAEGLLEITL